MKKYDVLIKRTRIAFQTGIWDIGIQKGRIAAIKPEIPELEAEIKIDASGCLTSPGFIDSHMHLDKAFLLRNHTSSDLAKASVATQEYVKSMSPEEAEEDILRRAQQAVDWAVQNGTTAIKTHLFCDSAWGDATFGATQNLKRLNSDRVDIFSIAPWTKAIDSQWRAAASAGMIDAVGGFPSCEPDFKANVDALFSKASEYALPLDLHVDESDRANIDCFLYIIDKTIRMNYETKVTCSHLTAMSGIDNAKVTDAVMGAKQAGIHIITLPSCNLYLMGRNDEPPERRGITRVREFLAASVDVSIASDNIRDPFRPFGNANLLQEALLLAQLIRCCNDAELEMVFRMITEYPALHTYRDRECRGVKPGAAADLVILGIDSISEAILSQSPCKYVIKNGRIVAGTSTALR